MTNAYRDENNVPTKIAVSNADGRTILRLKADETIHAVTVDDAATGTVTSVTNAPRDENNISVMMAVSSADGVTPITLAIDSITGKLLIKST